MTWFRLNVLSVGSLTTAILLAVITSYMLAMRRKGRDAWYLTGYLATLFILLLGYTARYSVFSAAALAFGQVPNLIVFGVACLIQFAYRFGGNPYKKEAQIVLAVSVAASIAAWASLFIPGRFPAVYDFNAEYFTYEYGPRISILTLVEYVWAFVVFIRRVAGEPGLASGVRYKGEISHGPGALLRVIRPGSRTAISHRSFALLTLATIPIALQYLLFQTHVVSRATYSIVFNSGALVICLLIFVVYVNNAPHTTSFLAKLVGVPLAVVMVTFGLTSNIVMPIVQTLVLDRSRAECGLAGSAIESRDPSRIPPDVLWVLSPAGPPDAFGFVSAESPSGEEALLTSLAGAGNAKRSGSAPFYGYAALSDTRSFFVSFPIVKKGVPYLVGFAYVDYRRAVHEFALKLALGALAACVLVVFGFPVAFRRGLLAPIATLLGAVRRVSSGNFRDRLPALPPDEIGRLAEGFNRMVESLRDMEGNFKALAENANDAILILSQSGRVLFANGRASMVTGIPTDTLTGSSFSELIAAYDTSLPESHPQAGEMQVRSRDGASIPVEITSAPTIWQSTSARVLILRDISERKRAEELLHSQQQQLMRSDKLASLGELVAGVAHEINNPNHVVAMNARFLSDGAPSLFALLEESAQIDEHARVAGMRYEEFRDACGTALRDIDSSARRIDHIVGELKRFVRGTGSKLEQVDVNEVVRTVTDLSRQLIRKSTSSFTLDLAADLPCVVGDFAALEQVVLNLVENACLSLPAIERGVGARTSFEEQSAEVVIEVSDEGNGISEADLCRITEPFFTTRAESGGTGLGLSIAKRIVRAHGGVLEFRSKQGHGTTATVRLRASTSGRSSGGR